jgi:hypothetical protein
MNKEQALDNFWNSFGIPAYDESSVQQNAEMPYITYSVATGSLNDIIGLTASIWYRSSSWKEITEKKNQIAEAIGVGGKVIKLDKGYLYLTRGSTFSQRITNSDDMVRHYYLQLNAEFLTEN